MNRFTPFPQRLGLCLAAALLGLPAADAQRSAGPPSSDGVIELDPMTVRAQGNSADRERRENFRWAIEQFGQGDHFHIRNGQLVDAIVFRHVYLQRHPQEKAIVVVVTEPRFHRVTQAVAAYTAGPALRASSSALGDVSLSGLVAADIAHPEKIRRYIQDVRRAYLEGSATLGTTMAIAETSGDYSHASQLYGGTADSMLLAAYHWLSNSDKAGLIPISRGEVKVDVPRLDPSGKMTVSSEEQDAIVFDWEGVHYFYNDGDGTLAKALPKNPITGSPCLVLKEGDDLESLYFAATYTRQYPKEAAVFIPAVAGRHGAAAFTRSGSLYMFSPFLGRFSLPPRYKIDDVAQLAKVHASLVAQEEQELAAKKLAKPPTSIPQEMPGDSSTEQIRRAYLAFKEIGLPVKFIEDRTELAGLSVTYRGKECIYLAPVFRHDPKAASFSLGEARPPF